MPSGGYADKVTRHEWLQQFEDELKKLRPHIGDRLAYALALQKYDAKRHPRELAPEYDKVQKREATLSAPAKKEAR